MDLPELQHWVFQTLNQAAEEDAPWPAALDCFAPLGTAWLLSAAGAPRPSVALLHWLTRHTHPLALHLLGFWGWHSPTESRNRLPRWALPDSLSFADPDTLDTLREDSSTGQINRLTAVYRSWEHRLKRSSHSAEQIRRLHGLARAQAGLEHPDAAVQALARPAWVVLRRRCSEDRSGMLSQLQQLEESLNPAHPLFAHYAALQRDAPPLRALGQDQRRATHFRQNYLQQLARGELAASALERELNGYLKANSLQIASLQALVRVPEAETSGLSYRLLNLPTDQAHIHAADLSFQNLGIFGWYGHQWHSALHFNAEETQRQRSYQEVLAQYWHPLSLEQLIRLSPRQPFHTSWIPEGDLRLAQLCAALLEPGADPETVLRQQNLHQPGPARAQLRDTLERWILLPRSQGNEEEWSPAQQPLALLAWVLGAETLVQTGAEMDLLPGARCLAQRDWPATVPPALQTWHSAYLALKSEQLANWLPWPLFAAELALTPPHSPPFVCFVHPLGYEQLGDSLQRVPAALICGRLYLPRDSAEQPFVASILREHLQPLSELCRDLVDTVMHRARQKATERLAQHQSELARLQERQRLFGHIQHQMRAYDQARQEAEQLWQGIAHALTPPAYAAYGMIDYQRLLNVFNEQHSLPGGIPGAHNLSSVTPSRLDAYFDYLNAGAIVTHTFLGQLQQSWEQLPERSTPLARRYFALLKLVVHDAFDPQRPLSLLQVLVALRLALQQRSVRYSLAMGDAHAGQDVSELLCPDRCSPSRFISSLADLSGFDFQALAYSFGTRPAHTLQLPAGVNAATVCLNLTQLLHTELHQPMSPEALHLETVRGLWHTPGSCLLWLECRGQSPSDWPAALQRAVGDTRPHGLRDTLAQLLQATAQREIHLFSVACVREIAPTAGLQVWNLPTQGRCILTLCLGEVLMPPFADLLTHWLSIWTATEHARTGI